MVRYFVVEYTPTVLIAIGILFASLKLFIIYSKGLTQNYLKILVWSFLPYNRQVVKNTFEENLKQYYKLSNTVNALFYALVLVILFVYLFMNLL